MSPDGSSQRVGAPDCPHEQNKAEGDLGAAPQAEPRVAPPIGLHAHHLVWAFYYPWYHRGDWDSPLLADRPTPRYDSLDPAVIEQQVATAQEVGIDGFLVSWKGPGTRSDEALGELLEVSERRHFLVVVSAGVLSRAA